MAEIDVLYHELRDELHAGGCALCGMARRGSDAYINALLHEGVTDVKLRDALRAARGLCHRHAWRMVHRRGSVLGTAIVYRDVVNALMQSLGTEAEGRPRLLGRGPGVTGQGLGPQAACPACKQENAAVARGAKTLIKHAGDAEIVVAYEAAGGLCVPHLQLALSLATPQAARVLAKAQTEAWGRLRGELDEVIRKNDHRFQREPVTDAEADAWRRAVAAVVGDDEREEE